MILRIIFLASTLIITQLQSGIIEKLDRFVEKVRLDDEVPAVSISIVEGNKIIFSKGYGSRKVNTSEKVDADTIFQLASVSKTFTSAGLGIEVDKGTLDWDSEVIQHLPQMILKDMYATRYVTARDLLAHRTGLPAFTGDLLGDVGYTRDQILSRIQYLEPAVSFRMKALYSNIGFFIAGQLLEKLSGTSFEEAIENSLLKPLKMTRSGFTKDMNLPNVAATHARVDGKIQEIPRNKSILFASAGGLYSTANDLGHWMIMHLNKGIFEGKTILLPETIEQIHQPSIVTDVSFTDSPPINKHSLLSFGLGWNNYQYHGNVIVEKGGALDGVRSVITLIPEKQLGISVLANLNMTLVPEKIRAKFLELYLGKSEESMDPIFDEQEKQIAQLLELPKKPKNAFPMRQNIRNYEGVFFSELYGNVNVSGTNENLSFQVGPGGYSGKLQHWSNDTFLLTWPLIDQGHQFVTFVFGSEEKAIEMKTETLGNFKRKS